MQSWWADLIKKLCSIRFILVSVYLREGKVGEEGLILAVVKLLDHCGPRLYQSSVV